MIAIAERPVKVCYPFVEMKIFEKLTVAIVAGGDAIKAPAPIPKEDGLRQALDALYAIKRLRGGESGATVRMTLRFVNRAGAKLRRSGPR